MTSCRNHNARQPENRHLGFQAALSASRLFDAQMRQCQIFGGLHFGQTAGGAGKFVGKIAFGIQLVDGGLCGGAEFDPVVVKHVHHQG